MTNEEILKAPAELLGPIDKQKKYVLGMALVRCPCPVCGRAANVFEAAGIEVNAYTFGREKLSFKCPACAVELRKVVPLMGPPWFWMRKFDNEEGT
jgi:hypothetical protein